VLLRRQYLARLLFCLWDLEMEMLSATHRVPQNTYIFSGMGTRVRRSCQ